MARINIISQGTEAARPPAGIPNRLYLATDTGKLYVDSGSAWNLAGGAAPHRAASAPTNPETGQIWIDTNTTPPTIKDWSGSAWEALRATPADGSVTDATVASGAAIDESKLNLASDAATNIASRRTIGTAALQAAAGNRGVIGGGTTGQLLSKNSGTDYDLIWANPGGVPQASETTGGTAEISTQGETDAVADDARIVTPLKLGNFNSLRLFPTVVPVTTDTTLTSSAFFKEHVCSGTTANYTVKLPSVTGQAGVIAFRMSGALTKLVTIQRSDSDTGSTGLIDGVASRVMRDGEWVLLYTDGATWFKRFGRSRAFFCQIRKTSAQTIAHNSLVRLDMNATDFDDALMADLTNDGIILRRASRYEFGAQVMFAQGLNTTSAQVYVDLNTNGNTVAYDERASFDTVASPLPRTNDKRSFAAGDLIFPRVKQLNTGSASRALDVAAAAWQPVLWARELVEW